MELIKKLVTVLFSRSRKYMQLVWSAIFGNVWYQSGGRLSLSCL